MCARMLPPQFRLLVLPRFSADVLESRSCRGSLPTGPTRTLVDVFSIPFLNSRLLLSPTESVLGPQQGGFPPKEGANSIWLLSEALGMHESTPHAELDSKWFPGFCWFSPGGKPSMALNPKVNTCFSLFYPKPSLYTPKTYHRSFTPK